MASFQQAQTMVFAIDEINKNPNLLPNITLGYYLYDNCVKLGVAFRAATALVSGTEESFSNVNCAGPPPVIAVVGDPGSTHSIAISSVLGLFRVPMVSVNIQFSRLIIIITVKRVLLQFCYCLILNLILICKTLKTAYNISFSTACVRNLIMHRKVICCSSLSLL